MALVPTVGHAFRRLSFSSSRRGKTRRVFLLYFIMIPVYYINLDRSVERNQDITDSLNKLGVDYHRISGIDAKNISRKAASNNLNDGMIQDMKYKVKHDARFSPREKEIAIILSHLKALTQAKEQEISIIMEDDMCFQYVRDWHQQIKNIIEEAPQDWSIIKLHSSSRLVIENNISLWEKGVKYNKLADLNSAGCYIIKKNMALQILSKYCIDGTYTFPHDNELCVCEHIIFNMPNTYIYTLPFICSVKNNVTCCGNYNILDSQSNKAIEEFWKTLGVNISCAHYKNKPKNKTALNIRQMMNNKKKETPQ